MLLLSVFYSLFSILILIVCIFLILIVLVQNSKGGGLASNFSNNQVMSVRKTADFLEKATWTLAGGLLVLSLLASLTIPRGSENVQERKSKIEEQINTSTDFSNIPDYQPEEETTEEE